MNKKKKDIKDIIDCDIKNIAIDHSTWKILKQVSLDTDTHMKIILKRLVEENLTV